MRKSSGSYYLFADEPNIQFTEAQIIQIKDSYPGLYDYYMRYKWNIPVGQTPSSAQHQMMAQSYRDLVKQVLRDYDNNAHSEAFYDALSWEGLKNTVAWNNLTLSEKSNINTLIINFDNSSTNCN
ncbi:hypothetical protein [Flavobacterium sp. 3HN19-14]|uniref:hypothetical protein n=1 Tax=Flavobacterium sp. 3HN19-14 TaxID=3448133 RepID=UPI003EE3BF36